MTIETPEKLFVFSMTDKFTRLPHNFKQVLVRLNTILLLDCFLLRFYGRENYIESLPDFRKTRLTELRKLIVSVTVPELNVEERTDKIG